jgi:hypothetical protein
VISLKVVQRLLRPDRFNRPASNHPGLLRPKIVETRLRAPLAAAKHSIIARPTGACQIDR